MSIFSQCYSVIIDQGIIATKHGKEMINDINAIGIQTCMVSDDGDNHYKYSYKFLYSINLEVGVSHSTCTNTWYK